MRVFTSVIAVLSLASLASATPARRDYETHDYFAVELEGLQPDIVACQLGVEVVERVGELDGHWLLRREKLAVQKRGVDDVVARWNKMRRDLKSSSYGRRDTSARSLKSLQHLTTRHRAKRVHIPSVPLRQRSPMEARDELSFAQETLHLEDPMLSQQWHLINIENKDIELNVTKLWERGVTGEGVKVAIIDDGLDATSDDLKDNFVRALASRSVC
jgi:kexin